jgi:hypothetical protein
MILGNPERFHLASILAQRGTFNAAQAPEPPYSSISLCERMRHSDELSELLKKRPSKQSFGTGSSAGEHLLMGLKPPSSKLGKKPLSRAILTRQG